MQLPPQAQPPEGAELRKPLDVDAAKTEIRRSTCSEAHLGHAGSASLIPRSSSKRCPQLPHSYSYSGMRGVYADATNASQLFSPAIETIVTDVVPKMALDEQHP